MNHVCVTSSVCEAQTTRRHNGLQSVCFSEVRRHKNVCASPRPTLPEKTLHRSIVLHLAATTTVATLLSNPASSDFPTIIVDCSSRRTTTLDRSIDRTPPCSPPLTSDSPVKPPAGDRRPHSYTGDFDLTEMGEKQQWTNEHLKCLLDTCIEEVESVGRKRLSLQKDSWIRLGRVLKEKFGVELTQKQMKNAYDNLKAKYTGWVYLKNKTGNIYNSQTNTFNLTAEEWDDFKKGHPKAASLRTIPLPFPDLCARLFDGNSATGNFRSYSTQSSSVAGASSCRVPPLQITATPFDAMDDDGVDTSHHEPPPSTASPSAASPSAASPSAGSPYTGSPYTATPSGNPNKRAKPSTPVAPSASPSASSPDGTSVTADDLAFEMKKALQILTKGYTIPQCLEKLEVLQLGPTDPLRFVAYHIFGGNMNMREMWMHLPDVPEILRGWLEMTGVAHDSRILSEAVADPQASFPFPPPDKYYLCDAAYAHTRGFMAPYRNPADVKKQTVFLLQTADVWSTSSAAEACRCGP
ncbi:unnamed protein product [Lactuca saligna]|uniref:Myb/SANT-like domain-containing protein n=1 Tax=Lactuca saligna TaxID=75948 RepID=A0AA36EMQ6_LACSI|nr:unnamed protein product [Lactuca saligna]